MRSAFAYEAINEVELVSQYPAILNAVESLGEPPDTALKRIVDLLKRHGSSVATIMRDEMSVQRLDPVPANSLPDLHGRAQRGQFLHRSRSIQNLISSLKSFSSLSLIRSAK